MKYYLAIKKKKHITSYGNTQHDEWVLNALCKRSQAQKDSYCMSSFIWYFGKGKTVETEERSIVSRAGSAGKEL